jgi:mono/diheme cytochrome c family protein
MNFSRYILAILLIATVGCRRDMFNQPSAKPLEYSDAFKNNEMASRPFVPHTIARGQLEDDSEFYTGKIGTNLVTTLPSPVTREMLERGQERYNIYCSPCHDRTGNGNGMIVQRGFPRPPSYHIDRLREAPIGHFYDVITHGWGIMYPYAARVEPADRWAIAAYIRVLQASQNSQVNDVPESQRNQLEAKK